MVDTLVGVLRWFNEKRLCTAFALGDLALEAWFGTTGAVWNVEKVTPSDQIVGGHEIWFEMGAGEAEGFAGFTGFCTCCEVSFSADGVMSGRIWDWAAFEGSNGGDDGLDKMRSEER